MILTLNKKQQIKNPALFCLINLKRWAKNQMFIMTNVANAVLYSLYQSPGEVIYTSLEMDLNDQFQYYQVDNALIELQRLQLLDTRIDNTGESWYALKQKVREEIAILPNDFENNPYEYFRWKEYKKEQEETAKKWYETENARMMFEDYPTTEKRARRSMQISIVTLILAALTLMLQWKCNKHG